MVTESTRVRRFIALRIPLLPIGRAVIGLTLARWRGQPPKTAPVPPEAATTPAPAVAREGRTPPR